MLCMADLPSELIFLQALDARKCLPIAWPAAVLAACTHSPHLSCMQLDGWQAEDQYCQHSVLPLQVPSVGASPAAPAGASELDKRQHRCSLFNKLSGSANCHPTNDYAGMQHGVTCRLLGSQAAGIQPASGSGGEGAGAATSARSRPFPRDAQLVSANFTSCYRILRVALKAAEAASIQVGAGGWPTRQQQRASPPAAA